MHPMQYFFVVFSFTIILKAHSQRSYEQWQCSLPTQASIYSLVHQNFEAFQLIDSVSWIMKKIIDMANAYAGGRVISVLEGGYALKSLPELVLNHVNILLEYE